MRILWIDDDRLYIRPIIEDIRDLGHTVDQIYHVDDGFTKAIAEGGNYQKIVLDIMLPARGDFNVPAARSGFRTGMVLLERLIAEVPGIAERLMVVSVVRDQEPQSMTSAHGVRYIFKSRVRAEDIVGG